MSKNSTESRSQSAFAKHFVKSRDGRQIRIRHFERGSDAALIVAPGYAQHGGSKTMQVVSENMAEGRDIVLIDFRGTGESDGCFTFGRDEWMDVQAVLDWTKRKFKRVELMGISLGAYSSLRSTVEGESKPDRLLLVSCPTRFDDVVFKGGMVKFTIRSLMKPEILFKERYPFFRWGNPLGGKPSATEFAPRLEVPVHFLVGTEDVLVSPKMSEEVYRAVRCSKTWASFEGADHAEFMFESHTASFIAWAAPLAT